MSFDFDVQVQRDRAVDEFFKGWGDPRVVDQRLKRAIGKGAVILARGIRTEAPVGLTGNLRRSVRSRSLRDRPGLGPAAVAGARRKRGPRIRMIAAQGLRHQDWAPHAGLVQGGHRIVTRSGRDTGRYARPNRFVDRGIARSIAAAEAAVQRELDRDLR